MKAHEISNTKNWKLISEKIRSQVNSTCERCGQKSKYPRKVLTIHHWDGDGGNNNVINLVALCQSCHMKAQALFIKACGMHEFWDLLAEKDEDDVAKGVKLKRDWNSKLGLIKEYNPD